MNTRRFIGTERMVSEVGLDCRQLGGTDWSSLDGKVAFDILSAALDAGVTKRE